MTAVILKIFVSYLLGSVNGSLVLGRFIGVDIRKEGSGNAGGTNALRTHGKLFALGVMIIDIVKSVIAVAWIAPMGEPGTALPWIEVACGAAAVIGHCYPVFFGFRGGKGMATLIGAYAVLAPAALIVVLLTWVVVLAASGYVGLATIVGAAAAPVYFAGTGASIGASLLFFGVFMAMLIIFTHRGNISRLRQGTEHRMFRALLSRRH
jgi:glycerol-3-phosphate acyltransferase PlsY